MVTWAFISLNLAQFSQSTSYYGLVNMVSAQTSWLRSGWERWGWRVPFRSDSRSNDRSQPFLVIECKICVWRSCWLDQIQWC
jgi:hypothetical protein